MPTSSASAWPAMRDYNSRARVQKLKAKPPTPPLNPLRHPTRLLNMRAHRLHKAARRQSLLVGDLVLRHKARQPPRHLAVIIRQKTRSKSSEVSVGVALEQSSHQAPPTVTVVVAIVCGHDRYDNRGRDLGIGHVGPVSAMTRLHIRQRSSFSLRYLLF